MGQRGAQRTSQNERPCSTPSGSECHQARPQQQLDFSVATLRPSPGRTVAPPAREAMGWEAMRCLMAADMVMKACSTLEEFLALVSRKGMPISSANA
jgi:hypothetical protein